MEIKTEELATRHRMTDAHSDLLQRQKRRKLFDRGANWLVAIGGFTIIASILAILIFILVEIAPLFESARVERIAEYPASALMADLPEEGDIIALGLDENQEIAYGLFADGRCIFYETKTRNPVAEFSLELDPESRVTACWQNLVGRQLALGTNRGDVLLVELGFNSQFLGGERSYRPQMQVVDRFHLHEQATAIVDVAFAGEVGASMAVSALSDNGRVFIYHKEVEESLFGSGEETITRYEVQRRWSGEPLSIAMDPAIRNLYIGADHGKIYHWKLSPDHEPAFVTSTRVTSSDAGVTAMSFLIGGRTLVIGNADGLVGAWFLVRDSTSTTGWRLTHIRDLKQHPAPVAAITASARGKGFISADTQGNLYLQYSTSGRFLAAFKGNDNSQPVRFINYAPKANGALSLDGAGVISHWRIDNPHPEAGLKAFFGKVWYEGYEKPEYVWQSTGGTDEFEPKLSLVPLTFGSLKGTLYALIIAVPLAIFAALYTSQFMHPSLRNKVKPAIEIMAALPSVVLGFLAGLWLAPRLENIVPAVLTMAIVLPGLTILAALVWSRIPRHLKARFRSGAESFLLMPILALGIWLCLQINSSVEASLFAGDFKVWLLDNLSLSFDQRNALVVGIAMGFAVIPIIYTISEDALSNVPRNLVSGSLALGATRWQTAVRVVLPTAAAGIFSAIMIGLGRAVGETMIVLMATGNTPIMDWNIFNGFRTLSANIAVEIPEAPVGGTLYRVLFLAAMLLFIITFLVNTMAELVRQRLREKYQKM